MKIFGDQQNFCNVSNQAGLNISTPSKKPIQFVRGEEKQ